MKINQILLKTATEPIKGLVPKKPLIPYHQHILIKTIDEKLEVRYTNNEAPYKTILIDGFKGDFNLCVDATLIEALGDVDSMMTFSLEENRCVVRVKGRKLTLPVLDPDSYPLEIGEHKKLFAVNSEDLRKAIDKCNGFGVVETRSAFHGIRFSNKDGMLEVGATDNHAVAYSIVNVSTSEEFGFNVGYQLCNTIKTISQNDDTLYVLESDKDVQWSCGLVTLTVRKGEYAKGLVPFSNKIDQLLESNTDVILIKDRKWFMDSIKTAIWFSDTEHTFVTIFLKENQITLEVTSNLGKKSEQTIDCIYPKEGDSTKVILNYTHFLKILGRLDGEDFSLRLAPEGDPIATPVFINEGESSFAMFPYIY